MYFTFCLTKKSKFIMKKTYCKPTTHTVHVELQQIIAESINVGVGSGTKNPGSSLSNGFRNPFDNLDNPF